MMHCYAHSVAMAPNKICFMELFITTIPTNPKVAGGRRSPVAGPHTIQSAWSWTDPLLEGSPEITQRSK